MRLVAVGVTVFEAYTDYTTRPLPPPFHFFLLNDRYYLTESVFSVQQSCSSLIITRVRRVDGQDDGGGFGVKATSRNASLAIFEM